MVTTGHSFGRSLLARSFKTGIPREGLARSVCWDRSGLLSSRDWRAGLFHILYGILLAGDVKLLHEL